MGCINQHDANDVLWKLVGVEADKHPAQRVSDKNVRAGKVGRDDEPAQVINQIVRCAWSGGRFALPQAGTIVTANERESRNGRLYHLPRRVIVASTSF